MSHTFTNLLYHVVFSTKDRRPWLDGDIGPRVHAYLGGAIRSEGGIALVINGVSDHVHILAKLRQDKSVSDVVRSIKANSSGWARKTFPGLRGFNWQTGYGAFTVSQSQLERVRRYIERQEAHHKTRTFKEEFIAMLRAHQIDFDERYL